MFKIAVVGSGPSGLFLTKNLLKFFKNNIKIDLFEKLYNVYGIEQILKELPILKTYQNFKNETPTEYLFNIINNIFFINITV